MEEKEELRSACSRCVPEGLIMYFRVWVTIFELDRGIARYNRRRELQIAGDMQPRLLA